VVLQFSNDTRGAALSFARFAALIGRLKFVSPLTLHWYLGLYVHSPVTNNRQACASGNRPRSETTTEENP
jgi:hypothetical protein